MNDHLCQKQHAGLPGGIRDLYNKLKVLATSETADIILIRSHIAYWSGNDAAQNAVIKPSKGSTYRINNSRIVRISDHYDHRAGITGWRAYGFKVQA